jgi:hypothetical protein
MEVLLTNERGHQNYVGNFLRTGLETTNPQKFPGDEELPLVAPKMNFSGQGEAAMDEENEEADDGILAVKPMRF